jgi:Tol biopolymer transport system component
LKADIGSMESLGLTRSGALYVVKPASTMSLQVVPIDLAQGRLTGPPVAQIYGADTPAWSSDSTRLAYMHRPPNGIPVLAIRSLESGSVQALKPRLLYMPMPTWLPDGKSIVTWGRDLNGKGVIVRVDVETGQQTHVTDAYDIQQVQVSPDGRKIYHSDDNFRGPAATNRGFFERDLATGAVQRIDFGGGLSPDGQLVARISVDEKSRTSTIVFVPPNGGEARRVNVPTRVEGFRGSSWMPDSQGLLVAETGDDTKHRSLWLVPISGAAPRRLDIDVSNWILPYGVRLSPDGRRIAFFTGQEASEVWAIENVTAVRGKR